MGCASSSAGVVHADTKTALATRQSAICDTVLLGFNSHTDLSIICVQANVFGLSWGCYDVSGGSWIVSTIGSYRLC
jgi:hypothetical protein